MINIAERLMDKVSKEETNGCWVWTGSCNQKGYGLISVAGRLTKAHRAAYQCYVGEIPTGLFVCHTCDNRKCINPSHLFVGTHRDNMRDMVKKGRSKFDEKHSMARLKNYQRQEIIELRREGKSAREIARMYGVHNSTVLRICKKEKE